MCFIGENPPVRPQSGKDNTCVITSGVLGGANVPDLSPARLCIGERVTSLRQLIKRFQPVIPASAPTLNATFWYTPMQMSLTQVDSVPAIYGGVYETDVYTLICSMFALQRGSVRWKFVPQVIEAASNVVAAGAVGYNVAWANSFVPSAYGTPSAGTYPLGRGRALSFFHTPANGGVEVEHPFYSRFHSVATADLLTSSASSLVNNLYLEAVSTMPRQIGYVTYNSTPSAAPVILRAAGEDFSAGLFCSTLPMTGYSGANGSG